jgi:hypothetical protein
MKLYIFLDKTEKNKCLNIKTIVLDSSLWVFICFFSPIKIKDLEQEKKKQKNKIKLRNFHVN